ncbi:hypothetical protein HRI_000468400 [Hibiscus trionum]|uniref:Uncharacterized protein n=1 Tax=Hibiscus trionum TaxID=183268 RepID=A0A9W7H1E3_HIBTR|nr:hypothetical protein HRI_000468400 [Hibiscus trionum]
MALLSLGANDNKENIPPFSSKNPTFSSPNNKKTRLRKPLQDIANLILPQICSTPIRSDTMIPVSSQALLSQAKCRKTRAINEVGSVCKMTCLVYKSGNFR